jgi:hypothetical protein
VIAGTTANTAARQTPNAGRRLSTTAAPSPVVSGSTARPRAIRPPLCCISSRVTRSGGLAVAATRAEVPHDPADSGLQMRYGSLSWSGPLTHCETYRRLGPGERALPRRRKAGDAGFPSRSTGRSLSVAGSALTTHGGPHPPGRRFPSRRACGLGRAAGGDNCRLKQGRAAACVKSLNAGRSAPAATRPRSQAFAPPA